MGESVRRLDGIAKASGSFRYAGDVSIENALIGKVLRSPHPHALIKSIDISLALSQPGVRTVLTGRDVTGTKTFGPIVQDQPVLCKDKVRHVGDAIALVAADSEEEAERALQHISVEFETLPVIRNPEEALREGAALIHEKGNLAFRDEYAKGDIAAAFLKADLVISDVYHTPRQRHMYVETEAGYGFPRRNRVDLYVSTQAPYHDRLEVSRALGIQLEKVRVVAFDPGGAFGGKEETALPIHLALLAVKTRRPVRMTWSREESGVSATTRHPMSMELKTGFRKDGVILANEARVFADTGAYMSYGASVLEVATGTLNGPYRIPNTHVVGFCVYTNNPPAGAMRGYGIAQVNFALETQLDIACEKLSLNPVELRKLNAAVEGDTDGTGTLPITKPRLMETLVAAEHSNLWLNRVNIRGQGNPSWLSRGVGFAAGLKSIGYGALPEQVKVSVKLDGEGYTLFISNPEMGSGTSTALTQIAAECLGTEISKIHLTRCDTRFGIDSGASNGSRVVYVVGNAIVRATDKLKKRILHEASKKLRLKPNLLRLTANAVIGTHGRKITLSKLVEKKAISASAWYSPPLPDRQLEGTVGLPNVLFSYTACVAQVEVNRLTGQVKVLDVAFLPEVGTVVNRVGLEAQCEGGIAQSIGFALMEDLLVQDGMVKNPNFTTYLVPTVADVPSPFIEAVDAHEPTGPLGAKGAGELPTIAVPAAICNAIYDAVGARLKTLPATPERILAAIEESKKQFVSERSARVSDCKGL